jgi:hypothetical protein
LPVGFKLSSQRDDDIPRIDSDTHVLDPPI